MAVPFNPPIRPAGARPKRPRRAVRHLATLAVAIASVALLGCEDTDPTEYRVIGHILFEHPTVAPQWPQIPETATAGVPVEIEFWTWGPSGCLRRADTEVAVNGRSAEVTPYDLLSWGPNVGCYPEYEFYRHEASVVFRESGTAEIVLVYSTESGKRPEDYRGDGREVYRVEVAEAG